MKLIDLSLEVYRVTWLREKDRMERWWEEIILCKTDLHCSRKWFKHKEQHWMNLSQMSLLQGKPGQYCYASKQVENWRTMGNSVQLVIDDLDRSVSTGIKQ